MPNASKGLGTRYPTALVTGASSGIGLAIARRLRKEGITVYGTSRDPARPGLDPDIRWLALEAATPDGLKQFIEAHRHLLTTVNILVNNCGAGCFGKPDDVPSEALRAQHHLLLETPVQLIQAVLPGMRERACGAIVNLTSLAAVFPLPYLASYSAGKAGLSGFTRALMLTEGHGGIVVIDFQAGDYRTGFNANMARYGDLDDRQLAAWARLEANLAAAPGPERAATDLVRALERGQCAVVRSGGFFQRTVAPLGARLLPHRLQLWAIRKYYRLP